nr:Uma2 family endonuclease [Pseudonocardia acaciae]
MRAAPVEVPTGLLTVAEYAALGEVEPGYTELVEGRLLFCPSSSLDHNVASSQLAMAIYTALPPGLEVLVNTDLDLGLASAGEPGTVRRPDIMVIRAGARRRVRDEGRLLRAADAVLVVEVVTPESERTDRIHKRTDYADAAIPHYWIVDISGTVSVTAEHTVTGTFRTTEPFAFELDLSRLT